MTRIGIIVGGAVLLTFVSIMCVAGQQHWPNFSCHTYNSSRLQQRSFNYNRMGWRSCLEKYIKYKGNCAHICALWNDDILVRNVTDGPVIFNVDAFIKFFAEELGYSLKGSGGAEKDLMTKVRSEMDACKAKHPEYEGMKSLTNTPCEPWKNFLQCFDTAIGCGLWTLSPQTP